MSTQDQLIWESLLEEALRQADKIPSNLAEQKCVDPPIGCGRPVVIAIGVEGGFRNELSLREYRQSALCMTCQDQIFGPD